MKKLSLFFLFITFLFSAQNQRFAYEYKFVADSTNKENVDKEMMYLDITKEGSKFYSREVFVSDSLINEEFKKQENIGSTDISIKTTGKGKVRFKVFKTYPDYSVYFETATGTDTYKVLDDRKIIWKILPGKEKIGEFLAQKATTEIYGRKWIAWFSPEIPLQDGPYKFHGLPGLIVKISDVSNSHVFELRAVAKFQDYPQEIPSSIIIEKPIEINQKQYKKLFTENRNDPAKGFRQMLANDANIEIKDASGQSLKMSDVIRNIEKKSKEFNLKDNNLLELDLLK